MLVSMEVLYRRMTYKEIAQLEGVQASRKGLVTAFKMKSYGRCVATSKPFLTEAQKQVRLAWAVEHLNWKPEQWATAI